MKPSKNSSKARNTATIALVIILFVFFTYRGFILGDVDLTIGDQAIEINTTIHDNKYSYGDVEKVTLIEDFDIGKPKTLVRMARLYSGKYENKEFGVYNLFAYKDVPVVIDMKLKDGTHVVFNQYTEEITRNVCNVLQ